MRFEGVFVANVTPFLSNGDLDLSTLDAHYQFLKEAGVHGFVPCGTTGEGTTLSDIERKQVIQMAVNSAKETELKVIAGCGTNDTLKTLKLIEEASDLGADATLLVTPYYNKPTQSGLVAHYEYLADRSPLPIILYNVPSRTNVPIQVDTAIELLKHEKIVGIKEASGNYGQWLQLSRLMPLKEKALLAGDDDAFALMQVLGGSGIISATANILPRQILDLYYFTLEGEWEKAFALQKTLYPAIQAMFIETNPSPVKYALSRFRKYSSKVRLPLVEPSLSSQKLIESTLGSFF